MTGKKGKSPGNEVDLPALPERELSESGEKMRYPESEAAEN